ncbi:disulfide bond formation protein B [Candidatus Wolfebacteria bacterium]|nr:disulfide bond formation protein B [Candidatus Wolfebacteria bacterium]
MITSFLNQFLGIAAILGQIFLAVGVVYFLLRKKSDDRIINFFAEKAFLISWLISLAAVAASLFYSEIAGFPPCNLCWWQRIFMYPQVALLGMALIKKDFKIIDYSLALALIGALFALYHNYIYYGGSSLFSCDASGLGVSCTRRYVWEFGYITIPLMSFTAFLLLIFFLAIRKYKNKLD